MEQTASAVNRMSTSILIPLFFILSMTSLSFAQDFESKKGQDIFISANLLTMVGTINSERMSISYNGISSATGMLYALEKNSQPGMDLEKSFTDENQFKFGEKLKQVTGYFLKYFNVEDLSSDETVTSSLLKSKVDISKENTNEFEFNLSLNIGSGVDTLVKMSAVKMESYWYRTYVNAVYNYEKSEIELGVSSAYINEYLLDGMKLEVQANPSEGSGAVLLTMSL